MVFKGILYLLCSGASKHVYVELIVIETSGGIVEPMGEVPEALILMCVFVCVCVYVRERESLRLLLLDILHILGAYSSKLCF